MLEMLMNKKDELPGDINPFLDLLGVREEAKYKGLSDTKIDVD